MGNIACSYCQERITSNYAWRKGLGRYGDGRYVSGCDVLRLGAGPKSSPSKRVIGEQDSLVGHQRTHLNTSEMR